MAEQKHIRQSRCKLRGYSSEYQGDRDKQEDRSYMEIEDGRSGIGIICDGIGGLMYGDAASGLAAETFLEDFAGREDRKEKYSAFLERELRLIDKKVAGLTDPFGRQVSCGTTIVAVIIDRAEITWASVGDSKIYIIRNGKIVQCNHDHNYKMKLDEWLQEGKIDQDTYNQESSSADALISYLGMGNLSLIDINPRPLKLLKGDVVLLCSDGLSKQLSEQEIADTVIQGNGDLENIVEELQEKARKTSCGDQDNTSIIIFSYQDE